MCSHSQSVGQVEAPPPLPDGNCGAPPPPSVSLEAEDKSAKKGTRKWAAWTRQEEESFFNALRQVGKNFERITSRVQSKNKDQVRHYYYRLRRRINKLLGPEFCLDAKNSKDTNAAMLRWWALLEKHSCTASKLHLKPRRFKLFIEALENQLLKDRNKSKRKQNSPEENYACNPSMATTLSRSSGDEGHTINMIEVEALNSHKTGTNRGPSRKSKSNFKKGNLTGKSAKQKHKGVSAAYRRWEKAAIAGVSLVADAAEQLELATSGHNYSSNRAVMRQNLTIGAIACTLPLGTAAGNCVHLVGEKIVHPSAKLKLQLFPINEDTRKALEKDIHNPHLELTLSARKRILSVLEHLNRKWGSSSVASGELMLFPYDAQQEDIASYKRWTMKDTISSAADVYTTIGCPSTFRLRYGWFSAQYFVAMPVDVPSEARHVNSSLQFNNIHESCVGTKCVSGKSISHDATGPGSPTRQLSQQSSEPFEEREKTTAIPPSVVSISEVTVATDATKCNGSNLCRQGDVPSSWLSEEHGNPSTHKQQDDEGLKGNVRALSGEWPDSSTNMSVGYLLSDASKVYGCAEVSPEREETSCLQGVQVNPDSFDAAVAAHASEYEMPSMLTHVSHPSILNDEDTCDGFSFLRNSHCKQIDSCSSSMLRASSHIGGTSSSNFRDHLKDLSKTRPSDEPSCKALKAESESTEASASDTEKVDSEKDICLTDIYWSDSLGLLDLDIPSSRYNGDCFSFGESMSLSTFGRILANSQGALSNYSYFGME